MPTAPSSTRIVFTRAIPGGAGANDTDFRVTWSVSQGRRDQSAKRHLPPGLPRSWLPDGRFTFRRHYSRSQQPRCGRWCFRREAELHFTHDNLFHTVLGLLESRLPVIERNWTSSTVPTGARMTGLESADEPQTTMFMTSW